MVLRLAIILGFIAAQVGIAWFLTWRHRSQFEPPPKDPPKEKKDKAAKKAKSKPDKEESGNKTEDKQQEKPQLPGWISGIFRLLITNSVLYVCLMILGPDWLPHKLYLHPSVQVGAIIYIVHYVVHYGKRHLNPEIYFPKDELWMGVVSLLHVGGYICFIQTLDRVSALLP